MKLETKQKTLIEQSVSIKSLNIKNYLLIKRIADIGMSLFVLFFSLPLMAILAVLIKLESKGPIFIHRQESEKTENFLTFIN